ncbi:MAG: GntR family transcriptional regulator [Pseudomonadota bacterium]|nr:GntR family transcriptional regulator [Pseudomonadota bacterium]
MINLHTMMHVQASPSFRPLYEQIKILLTQSLIAGEWRPGESIPSEIELAGRFRVSQGTVRKAVDELAAEHILVRRQGKGTFVATHAEPQVRHRFLRVIADSGEREPVESRLVECKRGKAPAVAGKALGLKTGAAIFTIKRLLVFSGQPMIFDEITLPEAMFKGLSPERLTSYKNSYYSLYESQYGVRMIRAEERLKAVVADPKAAQLLEIDLGAPLLCVDRIAYTYGDRPVEWRRGYCNTDTHCYVNELT